MIGRTAPKHVVLTLASVICLSATVSDANNYSQLLINKLTETSSQTIKQPQELISPLNNSIDPAMIKKRNNQALQEKHRSPSPIKSNQLWNLKNVDISMLINEIGKITHKNFIVGPKVTGKVTFITYEPLDNLALYQAFLNTLDVYGYLAIKEGKVIKIIRKNDLKDVQAPLGRRSRYAQPNAEIVTTTIHIKNGMAQSVWQAIKPLLSATDVVSIYAPSNHLIISSYASNVERVKKIIRKIDRPVIDMELYPLLHASAKELAKALSDMQSRNKNLPGTQALGVTADARTNSLIISGGTTRQRINLRGILVKLDIPKDQEESHMEVIYLKQQRAENIAPIIDGIIQNFLEKYHKNNAKTNSSYQASARVQTTTSTLPSVNNLLRPIDNTTAKNSDESDLFKDEPLEAHKSKSGVVSQYVQWDESTNAVIITAPKYLIKKIKKVIDKLDIRRPQVLMQVVIAEIVANKASELGIEWRLGKSFNTRFGSDLGTSIIGTDNKIGSAAADSLLGQGLTLGFFRGENIIPLISALARNTQSNILSTPNLVTLDNETAEIRVGRRVSFAIGQIENNPTGGNPFTSFDREDVGLILKIRPQITQKGMIKLTIHQEISSVVPSTNQDRPGSNPDTSNRSIKTTVTADNNRILVLGGLLQDDWQDVVSKVPLLGDIPLIGHLFRNHHRSKVKTNLMIFIKPMILYDALDSEEASQDKYDFIRHMQKVAPHTRSLISNIKQPYLPGLNQQGEIKLPVPFSEV